jgi:hypothetical protein
MLPEDIEKEIEIAVIRAFGWAVIEFEAVLYQKFLVMSASSSLMTEVTFKKHLKSMQAKGYISPIDFQRKCAWKRQVVESDIDEEAMTPEEVKSFLEKARANEKPRKEYNNFHQRKLLVNQKN